MEDTDMMKQKERKTRVQRKLYTFIAGNNTSLWLNRFLSKNQPLMLIS